jgi:lipopolysaccharide transport system permease protein
MMSSETTRVVNESVAAEIQAPPHETELKGESESAMPEHPVVVNDANAASAAFNLRDIWAYRELLYFLTWRDIKVKYKQTTMGAAWAIIQPLFMVLVFAVFFGIVMQVPTDEMPFMLFFYCGMMPWIFFSNSIFMCSGSLISNTNLITKIYFPRTIIPAATIGAGLPDLLISVALLIGLVIYYRIDLTWYILLLPAMLLLTIWLALAFGIWLAALTVRYRDIRHALSFVLQLWMFTTPIIYPLSLVNEKWRWVMYLNPMTGVVEGIRSSVMGRSINVAAILFSVGIAVVSLIVSIFAFRRLEKGFADLL